MKKLFYSIIALVAVVSCGKEDFSARMPEGESVALTIPQTKVGLDGNSYAFESGDVIIAVASNGSVAALANTGDAVSTFSGTFSEPLGDSKAISLYYNCCDASGNVSYVQNGKPWLVALDQTYTRGEDNNIEISAALDAPKGVKAVGVVSTCGASAFDFHAFDAAVSSFDGSSFSGDNAVSGVALVGDDASKSAFVNVPEGMTGGFWLKFSDAEDHSMYKKYASSTAVTSNMKVAVSEFVPADVNINVSVTGFPTSYSWYIGNEGISGISGKDVSIANSKSNDWMGAGEASYTISKEGIPASLLTFDSFKLVVDGDSFTYTGEEGKPIAVAETHGHNTWGQKDVTATVTYKAIDGVEFTKSATITRHITGLPYVANPPKNTGDNPWSSNYQLALNNVDFNDDNVFLSAISRAPEITSSAFSIPSDVNVIVNTKHSLKYSHILWMTQKTIFNVDVNGVNIISNGNECDNLEMKGEGTFTANNSFVKCKSTYSASSPSVTLYSVGISYR